MKHIKTFIQLNETIIGKLTDKTAVSSIFNYDPLTLKEFIQTEFKLSNLKYLGGGAMGLAFLWGDKVIKVTTDKSEKENIEYMIDKK
jgi:hypothetical protein